jgi:hypothetical protein
MNIVNAKYFKDGLDNIDGIIATINGVFMSVPLDPANTHYAEIMRQVDAGELTIADAD